MRTMMKVVCAMTAVAFLAGFALYRKTPDAGALNLTVSVGGSMSAPQGGGNGTADTPDTAPLPTQLGITEDTDGQYVAAYQKIQANDRLALYADMQKGWLALKNRESGKIWYSVPNDSETDETTVGSTRMDVRSDLIVEYLDTQNMKEAVSSYANSHTQAVRQETVKTELLPDGIRVTYDFRELGFVIPVEHRLRADYLETRIRMDEIQETGSFVLLSIRLLPNFGAGGTETDGWMLIPDGSGAIARFNTARYSQYGYLSPVYGKDFANEEPLRQAAVSQAVRMPVFGIGQGEDSLFSIITEGESAAGIQAELSSSSFGYNTLSSRVTLRSLTNIEINGRNATRVSGHGYAEPGYTVRYYCLSGENADYTGMAKTYRQFLIDEKHMQKTDLMPALNLDIVGAVEVKANLLGIPYQKLKSLTSFSQAQTMAAALQSGGAVISVRYEGWTNRGLLNAKAPKDAKPLSVLGGNTGFDTLAAFLRDSGGQLWPDVDFLRFRQSGNGISRGRDSIKNAFGEETVQYDYMLSVYAAKLNGNHYRFLRSDKILSVSKLFLENYKKRNVNAVSLGTLGEYCYSDYNAAGGSGRTKFAAAAEEIMKTAAQSNRVAVAGGNACTAVYADKVWRAPLFSSGYDFFEKDVPFYQIVFHGYTVLTTPPLNQSANDRTLFLNAVETGTELLFSGIYEDASTLSETAYSGLYSTTFALWREKAAAYDKEYRSLLERIHDKAIVAHRQLSDTVYKTTWEDGTVVYVNYGDSPAAAEGVTIGGMDFEAAIS